MNQIYTLHQALTLNTTAAKYDAVAIPVLLTEIKKHKRHFTFNFSILHNQGYTVYKLCKVAEPDVLQGLVAFRLSPGVLECANMETAIHNRGNAGIYSGMGKAIIALCCKVSADNGLDGYITFDAKNRLVPYYRRYGAFLIHGNRMGMDDKAGMKLIRIYF